MSAVNKVILVGNVGKEPEIATVGTGARVAKFSLATSERWTDKKTGDKKESTEWHSVVVWNEALVGVIERYVRKGSKLYLEGAIKTRKWQGKDGQDKYSTEIVLQGFNAQMVMLDGPSSGSTGRSGRADPDGINRTWTTPRRQSSRWLRRRTGPRRRIGGTRVRPCSTTRFHSLRGEH
jgi:single-strand DNA-binding protein